MDLAAFVRFVTDFQLPLSVNTTKECFRIQTSQRQSLRDPVQNALGFDNFCSAVKLCVEQVSLGGSDQPSGALDETAHPLTASCFAVPVAEAALNWKKELHPVESRRKRSLRSTRPVEDPPPQSNDDLIEHRRDTMELFNTKLVEVMRMGPQLTQVCFTE